MISVIHPSSHFQGARVPPSLQPMPMHGAYQTGQIYGHQLMMAAKAGEQISDLYRRRDSGYTHHVSNSDYLLRSRQSLSNQAYSKAVSTPQPRGRGLVLPPSGSSGKDFSKPLFVDCSIEYELPNAPKIPKNSLPILMIHPGYKAKCHRGVPCQCNNKVQPQPQPQPPKIQKRTLKRSYNQAMNNSTVDYYSKIQHLPSNNTATHQGYFDNSSTSSALMQQAAIAKRSRLQMAEKQLFNQQFFQQQQQQQQQHQMQQALRHYTYYHQQQNSRADLRISSFQQITPPESLAFWQQQQMLRNSTQTQFNTNLHAAGQGSNLHQPYPMPPTPMMTNNSGFCIGCARCQSGKCSQPKQKSGALRSL